MKDNTGHKLLVIILLILTLALFAFLKLKDKIFENYANNTEVYEDYSEDDAYMVRYEGKWYKQNSKLDTFLLIGVDGKQADFLVLLAVDRESKNYKAIQINRDTMADVPQLDIYGAEIGTKNQQLALAHTHSDNEETNCLNTVKAVSNLLYGIDINHYVCISMETVPKINDLVGGVPVLIEDDFSKVDSSLIQGKTMVLHGTQALNFVRARSSMEDPTNIARLKRQRAYMHSLQEQVQNKMNADSNFIMYSLLEISPEIISDCTINELAEVLDVAVRGKQSDILEIKGEAKLGTEYMEFHVDEQALQKQVIDLFFVESDE